VRYHFKKRQAGSADIGDFVRVEKGLGPEGRIAVVRFDRGDGINALSPEALRQLTDAARGFVDDSESGRGAHRVRQAFSAGFDLKDAEGPVAQHHGYRFVAPGTSNWAALSRACRR